MNFVNVHDDINTKRNVYDNKIMEAVMGTTNNEDEDENYEEEFELLSLRMLQKFLFN